MTVRSPLFPPKAVQQLFHGNNNAALGAEVDFTNTDGRNTSFVVVGVYEETASKGGLVNFGDESIMYVPWPSESRFANADGAWDSVSVRPAPGTDDAKSNKKCRNSLTSSTKTTSTTGSQ